ncbi:hypothetical protein PHET_07326 [Paragonimus heterotremus]|uniref:Adenylate cyclase n=1 Tax=Paragonimus heterotremus TaxID=100268 RepID=A0A8J4WFV5_9TREM|nr:hypothetical protein PHET_07326 [Paragonimus heterotremus]
MLLSVGHTPLAKVGHVCLIVFFVFFANLTVTGFNFVTNQYVLYRYSEDAGIPYVTSASQNYKNLSPSIRIYNDDIHDRVQAKTANVLGLMDLLSLGCSIVVVLYVGYLSDRYGRLLAIGVVLLGQGLSHAVTACVVLLHLPVLVLIVASLSRGVIGGGLIALITQVGVCFADMTQFPTIAADTADGPCDDQMKVQPDRNKMERNRLILFGVFDAAIMFSNALSYSLMGPIVERLGFIASVLGLLSLYCIPVILIWFMPETRHLSLSASDSVPVNTYSSMQARADSSLDLLNSPDCPAVMQPTSRSTSYGLVATWAIVKSQHPATLLIMIIVFLYCIFVLSDTQFTFLYLMSSPFCWTPEGVGLYNGLCHFILAIVSVTLTLTTAWSMRAKSTPIELTVSIPGSRSASGSRLALLDAEDIVAEIVVSSASVSTAHSRNMPPRQQAHLRVIRSHLRMFIYLSCGLFMITMSKLIMGFAFKLPNPLCNAAVFVALTFNFVRAAVVPTLKSFLSSLHSVDNQGRLFSLFGMAEYFGFMIGAPSLAAMYAATVGLFPGAVYLLSAGLGAITVALALVLLHSAVRELSVLHAKDQIE